VGTLPLDHGGRLLPLILFIFGFIETSDESLDAGPRSFFLEEHCKRINKFVEKIYYEDGLKA
jgi:hypothetical protein